MHVDKPLAKCIGLARKGATTATAYILCRNRSLSRARVPNINCTFGTRLIHSSLVSEDLSTFGAEAIFNCRVILANKGYSQSRLPISLRLMSRPYR